MSSGGLRGLEHPPKVWHNSQLSSCVTTIVTDKQQLIAKTNNKLTGLALNGSFLLLLGLKQPSLSSSRLQERVNGDTAPTFLKSWTRPCEGCGLCNHFNLHMHMVLRYCLCMNYISVLLSCMLATLSHDCDIKHTCTQRQMFFRRSFFSVS